MERNTRIPAGIVKYSRVNGYKLAQLADRPMKQVLSRHLTSHAPRTRPRLKLFERSVKCGVEFCFFLVRTCLRGSGEIFARRIIDLELKNS
jgi:hypothetical protein